MSSEFVSVEKQSEPTLIRPRSWLWLNFFLLALLLIVMGASISFYYVKAQQLSKTVAQLSGEVEVSQQTLFLASDHIKNLQNKSNQQAMALREQQHLLKRLSLFTQQRQWQLDEIGYLIRLANRSLVLGQDIGASRTLLNEAHLIIQGMHDSSLDPLDKAIQADMHKLSAINQLDVRSLFLQVVQLEESVDKMPLLGSSVVNDETGSPEEVATEKSTWRYHIQQFFQHMKNFIIVHKSSTSLLPLIAQEQGEYINQYLHMQLGQVQWALLHYDNSVYQASLNQILQWVNRYYVILNPMTQDVLSRVAALQSNNTDFPPVTLTETLRAWNNVAHS